jgi:hypothetical protein
MKKNVLLVLLVLAASLGGCAFGTRQVTLTYPPNNTAEVVPSVHAETPVSPSQRTIVIDFVDRRSEQQVIGEVRNGWGMRTADVVPLNSVPNWVVDAVKVDLEGAGYTVLHRDASQASLHDALLSGEILTVYCTALFSYEGEVSFIAKLTKDGKERLNKRYSGKGTAGLNWAATSDTYGQSLALALSDAVKQLIQDLENLKD